jgi:alpha/beta superfamily hydrolase
MMVVMFSLESRPAKLAMAWPRTAAYVAHSMTRAFLTDRQRHPDIPTKLTTPGLVASVLVDEVALAFMPALSCDRAQLERVREETDATIALFQSRGWLNDPLSYHRMPPAPHAPQFQPRRYAHIRYEELTFDSGYEPPADLPGAERWGPAGPNARVHAFVLRHRGEPRPWVVNLHGLTMGRPSDLVVMQAMHWFRRRGFNVIQPVAPLHGARGEGRQARALISLDYLDNVHGFSQAIWDLRRCLEWVCQQDAPSITVHGISLGGFLAALLASIDDRVDRVISGMPLVDLGGVGNRTPRRPRRLLEEHGLLGERAELVHRVVSPLALPCRVEHGARHIYAGVGDRFTTAGQAYDLWKHWDEPQVLWFSGSHVADWAGSKSSFLDRAIGSAAPA